MKFILIFILMCTEFIHAQRMWTYFTEKDGLASIRIQAILEDKQGNMWFGTNKGLNKFDGKNWETFTDKEGLHDKNVKALAEDKNGGIWIGTEKGLCKYDGKKLILLAAGYFINEIKKDNNGNLWIGGSICELGGLNSMGIVFKFDGVSLDPFTRLAGDDLNPIYKIIPDNKGNIWIVTYYSSGNFIFQYNGTSWKAYGMEEGLPSDASSLQVKTALEDNRGNLWLGSCARKRLSAGEYTFWGIVMKFNGNNWSTYETERSKLLVNCVKELIEDANGNIWAGTNYGLQVFDGNRWVHYTVRDKLPGNNVQSIIKDSKGRIWIGTDKGLALFDGDTWSQFNKENGLASVSISTVNEDNKGNIWVSRSALVECGASVYNGEKWESFTSSKLSYTDFFEDSKGNLWFITNKGLWRFEY